MRFGVALDLIVTKGGYITRKIWRGESKVGFHIPDARSEMNTPYFYQSIDMPDLDEPLKMPWACMPHDMTAHDWEHVDDVR